MTLSQYLHLDARRKGDRSTAHSQPVVLLAATVWWPLSARLAVALVQAGCVVKAICPPGHPLHYVRGTNKIYDYRRIDSLAALEDAIRDARPDMIVPCDDGAVWQLHDLYELKNDLRALIVRSLGSAGAYATIRSRGHFLAAAAELGVRVPQTQILDSEQQLAAWWTQPSTSAVLKLDGTWGGTGVAIAQSKEQGLEAFRNMKRPSGMSLAIKRSLVNRDPLALWAWRKKVKPAVCIQEFIAGRPANTMFLAHQGTLLSIVTVEVLCAQGMTGAATVVRVIQNDEIKDAATVIAQRFELSGFHGLDFILEEATGGAYLIEMNPRCTQLGHLQLEGQGDLAEALYTQLSGAAPSPSPDSIQGDTIAFYPQASAWNPENPYLLTGHHDVPWEEPELAHELLRESWPDRQWTARIYHRFRAPKRDESVDFKDLASVPSRSAIR